MKICIISSIFPPEARGGAEIVVETTAQAFAASGDAVVVITAAPFSGWGSLAGKWEEREIKNEKCKIKNGEREEGRMPNAPSPYPLPRGEGDRGSGEGRKMQEVEYRMRIFRFTPFNLFTIFNIGKYPPLLRLIWHVLDIFNAHTYLVVRKILLREKPDLIITRNLKGLGYTVPGAIRSYKKLQKVTKSYKKLQKVTPHVTSGNLGQPPVTSSNLVWLHGLHDLGALHPRGFMEWGAEEVVRRPNPLVRLYRAVARKMFGSPDVIVAPSQFVLDEYTRVGFFPRAKKIVIRNPVFHNSPPPPLTLRGGAFNTIPPLRVRGGEEGLRVRFLYVGQLESYKGLRVLLAAWREFVRTERNARLEIIGTGSMAEEVSHTAQSLYGVIYRGKISHEKLTAIYAGACATIVPSLAYETFGLVVAESFAASVPVIASRIGGLVEIIQDGVNGILITPGDSGELAGALRKMMDPVAHKNLATQACQASVGLSLAQYREALQGLT